MPEPQPSLVRAIHDDRERALDVHVDPMAGDMAYMVAFLKRWKYAIPFIAGAVAYCSNHWIVIPIEENRKAVADVSNKIAIVESSSNARIAELSAKMDVAQSQNIVIFREVDKTNRSIERLEDWFRGHPSTTSSASLK